MKNEAKKIFTQKFESDTDCSPLDAISEHTHLGADMPPVTLGSASGERIRLGQKPYTNGMMVKKSTAKKVATGAAILGGLAAGAYALYKTSQKSEGVKSVGNSLAGWLPNGEPITIRKRRTIRAKSSALYAEWRRFENLPSILSHLKEVKMLDDTRSYWEAKGPIGTSVSWYATITEDVPGLAISWQSEEGAEVPNSGRITFNETPKGDTLMEVRLTYQPPAGRLGKAVATAFGENPAKQIEDDLTNFKFAMEKKASSIEA